MDDTSERIAGELAEMLVQSLGAEEGECTREEMIMGLCMAIQMIADREVGLIDLAVDRLVSCGA